MGYQKAEEGLKPSWDGQRSSLSSPSSGDEVTPPPCSHRTRSPVHSSFTRSLIAPSLIAPSLILL